MAIKLKSGEIIMTFSEAMDALLDGNKVRQSYWVEDNAYIMLDSHGDIVDNLGRPYNINNKTDLMLSWELYQSKVTVGALLSLADNQYRVVLNELNASDKLDIVDTKTWKVFIENVSKDELDDVIRSYGMKVINDGSTD